MQKHTLCIFSLSLFSNIMKHILIFPIHLSRTSSSLGCSFDSLSFFLAVSLPHPLPSANHLDLPSSQAHSCLLPVVVPNNLSHGACTTLPSLLISLLVHISSVPGRVVPSPTYKSPLLEFSVALLRLTLSTVVFIFLLMEKHRI